MSVTTEAMALEELGANVIRGLAMDAPQKAGNGHPGTAMALAPLAHVLFTRIMQHAPHTPDWPDRDRFVLSCGHASILQYSLLYLTGYGLELDDLKQFRQLGSRTPGHPERHHTAGVELTTGPLGQGFGNGVGLALAEAGLRARFGADVIDHHTFVLCSDGDLMEGLSHEAGSLAGHLGLGRLICIYDDNKITIDGPTSLALTDDPVKRFDAYGWHVEDLGEMANDLDGLEAAIRRAMAVEDKPSMLVLHSHIGFGSPLQDTSKAHGNPLGDDNVKKAKETLGLPVDESFWVPDDVLALYRSAVEVGEAKVAEWQARFDAWGGDKAAWAAAWDGTGVDGWEAHLPTWKVGEKVATRVAGKDVINAVAAVVPGLVAGGADLTENTGVLLEGEPVTPTALGNRLVHYGVREHGMAAAMNGMAAHGGVLPVGGTFFVFSDYCRPAVRVGALAGYKTIWSFTHDSIGLGADGPTHQPIEHLASLRAMPGLRLLRPADANETAHAYRVAIESSGPTVLVLSRQNLPVLKGTEGAYAGVARGAYVLLEDDDAEITLLATGSEVSLCLETVPVLASRGIIARVVSMPSWDLFEEQDGDYIESVLPDMPVLAVEAASSFGWDRWADAIVAIDTFGASGDGAAVMEAYGFTTEDVASEAQQLLLALSDDDDDD